LLIDVFSQYSLQNLIILSDNWSFDELRDDKVHEPLIVC